MEELTKSLADYQAAKEEIEQYYEQLENGERKEFSDVIEENFIDAEMNMVNEFSKVIYELSNGRLTQDELMKANKHGGDKMIPLIERYIEEYTLETLEVKG